MKKAIPYMLVMVLGGWFLAFGKVANARADDAAKPPDQKRVADRADNESDDGDPLAGPKNPRRDRADRDDPAHDDEYEDDDDARMQGDREAWGRARDGSRRRNWRGRGPGHPRDGMHRPGDGPDDGQGPREPIPITPEMQERILKVLESRLPEWHDRLVRARERKPEMFRRAMRRIAPMMLEFLDLEQRNPEMAELVIDEFRIEHEVRELARQVKDLDRSAESDAARDAIVDQIRDKLTRQHELQVQRRRFHLDQFRRRLEQQQARLAEEQQRLEEDAGQFPERLEHRLTLLREGRIREAFGRPDRNRHDRGDFNRHRHRRADRDDDSRRRPPDRDGPPDREGPPDRHGPPDRGPPPDRNGPPDDMP